jgi:hypothetical protein
MTLMMVSIRVLSNQRMKSPSRGSRLKGHTAAARSFCAIR